MGKCRSVAIAALRHDAYIHKERETDMYCVYSSLDEAGLERILSHYGRLEPEALARRFHGGIGEAGLVRYLETASPDVLVTLEEDGLVRGIMEVHGGPRAEGALSIEQAWRGYGHGQGLFERAVEAAALGGISDIEFMVSTHNPAMRAILRHSGCVEHLIDSGLMLGVLSTGVAA